MTSPRSSRELIEELRTVGFVLLRGAIDPAACTSYVADTVMPAIHAYSPYREVEPSSWLTIADRMIAPTGGDMVRDASGPDVHHMDPIKQGGRWPFLFECEALNAFLDEWHATTTSASLASTRNWQWLHDDNVGWIHIRFPQKQGAWEDIPSTGWHVDGSHFDSHRINSPEQSVVVLPVMRDIDMKGGGTSILKYSHTEVADFLSRQGRWGSSKRRLNEYVGYLVSKERYRHERNSAESNFVQCVASAGDILILHPFVAHAASICEEPNPWRITFNMGTRWARSTNVDTLYSPTVRDDASAGSLHYDEPFFMKFTFDLSKSICPGPFSSGCAPVKCDRASAAWKDEDRFEFKVVPFVSSVSHTIAGHKTGDKVRLGDKVLIKCRREGLFLSVEEGGRVVATSGPSGEVTEALSEKCVFEILPHYGCGGLEGECHVPCNKGVYLFSVFAQKHLNIDGQFVNETSCAVDCRWNDPGEWQEMIFWK
jgi:hypothetical protein